MTTGDSTTSQLSGQAILNCLKSILERCEQAGERLNFPGEGGERPFRGWLVSDLLIALLGWPSGKAVVGERFDVLLQDADNFPVVTIETKTPYHVTSKKERADFEARLAGYGTLHTAYLTNGAEWERLDISCPSGTLEIRDRFELHLETATPEEVEAFFAPLFADRHLRGVPRLSRHAVNHNNPHTLQALAVDLDQSVGDLAAFFESLFANLRDGKAGEQCRDVAIALFNLWCEKSLIIVLGQAAEQLTNRFKKQGKATLDIAQALGDFGLTGSGMAQAAEQLSAMPQQKRQDVESVANALWPAYETAIRTLAAQTAHVFLGRALLYRIGEDQAVFPRALSGEAMEKALALSPSPVLEKPLPATEMLSAMRLSMQSFLPAVYQLGEFDWWLITPDKRAALTYTQRAWLRPADADFETLAQRLLRMLNGYFFGGVDVDVWRNVYQHYLPAEERQRLGGFYTPDELVGLVLDLCEYTPKVRGLCDLSFIDPACGNGAFVTGALGRLLAHLRLDLPCHASLHKRNLPEWKRAEQILNVVSERLHAVDIHPFAAFLTTLNVLFLLLPLYVKAREKNPNFSLDLQIFSADSLEKPDGELFQPDLFARLNSRVQLTQESYQRYQKVLQSRFDRVFGNPPWGGVLKGPLAPVYDNVKKQRFAVEFPSAAQGKYDVYGLFMERALQILKPGGRFGLITQGSFIDKEWAIGLRQLLVTRAHLRYIVDLNPFGQLFFHAMNTPCITVADSLADGDGKGECIAVISMTPDHFEEKQREDRHRRVTATIRVAIKQVIGHKIAEVDFAHVAKIPLKTLRATAKDRWNLVGPSTTTELLEGWYTAADLLEMRQGVTPGGCLDIFLMTEKEAKERKLERLLIHRAIKSKAVQRWHVEWDGLALFYPYIVTRDRAVPAFTLDVRRIKDGELERKLKTLGIQDALDFDKVLDDRELEVVRRRGINRSSVGDLLAHRIALGLVEYPAAARYLIQDYERLSERVFEKKRFTEMGKRWYEYHRPRDPAIMLGKQRIVSPTLVKQVRFALDNIGYLSDHACLYLQPTTKTVKAWTVLRNQLTKALKREATDEDALKYCMAFLNSAYAQERLTVGHRPTPRGFYAISEEYLREIRISPPTKKAIRVLELVDQLVAGNGEKETTRLESQLAKVVKSILS